GFSLSLARRFAHEPRSDHPSQKGWPRYPPAVEESAKEPGIFNADASLPFGTQTVALPATSPRRPAPDLPARSAVDQPTKSKDCSADTVHGNPYRVGSACHRIHYNNI